MAGPRKSRQGDCDDELFVRALQREEREQHSEAGGSSFAGLDPLEGGDESAAEDESLSDLYRQHSHQQSMEGG